MLSRVRFFLGYGTVSAHQRAEERSEDFQEIFEKVPSWYLRFGITAIFVVCAMILFGCWLIRYPDIISSRILITTDVPPTRLVSRIGGKIHFLTADERFVKNNEILGFVEGAFDHQDILHLKAKIEGWQQTIAEGKLSNVVLPANDLQLGDLQDSYAELQTALRNYSTHNRLLSSQKKLSSLQLRISQYQDLNTRLEAQKEIQAKEVDLTKKMLDVNQKLFDNNVISEMDFDKFRINYFEVKRLYETSENNILNNSITITELKSQLIDLMSTDANLQDKLYSDVLNAYKRLESRIADVQREYFFSAPFDGKVSILKFFTNNEFVSPGTAVIAIVPMSENIYGQAMLPSEGSGKVEVGQTVNIKLDNYPYAEYGMIIGKVKSISSVPVENKYSIKIELAKGLKTNFNKPLPFRQELSGNAEIITKDYSILDRIFYQILSLFNNQEAR